MTISKLNKTYKNDLTTKLNAQDFQENVDKIDEIINQSNRQGVYRLTSVLNISTIESEIILADSIENYDFILICTGAPSSSNYRHSLQMPFLANFSGNQRSRSNLDGWLQSTLVATTTSGEVTLSVVNSTTLKVDSYSGNESLRGVLGIKLF